MNVLKAFSELKSTSAAQLRKQFGGKALGLLEAQRLGLSVPTGWLLATDHYEAFTTEHPHLKHDEFKTQARTYLQKLLQKELDALPDSLYAVRSSSQYEDSSEHSFAGIFESKLNVSKPNLIEAIAAVWESCFSLRASSYLNGEDVLRMGVILQPMVQSKYAGVCFSRHPSPSNIFENQHIVIEFAPTSGEQIVQGEVTPFRLSGQIADLSSISDAPWLDALLKAVLALKNAYHHEIDIEFTVDAHEKFWLLQQRPISKVSTSHTLDLKFYQRKYKRSLLNLDIELLIDGCSQFLASYLEVPYQFERWMVMITAADGQQELWVHALLDQATVYKIGKKALSEDGYLERIEQRYLDTHQKILNYPYSSFLAKELSLAHSFFQWTEFLTPLWAHYYTPMFMIDALHVILLDSFRKIDPLHAENDLFEMGTSGVSSLSELLQDELARLKSKMGALPSSYAALSPLHQETLTDLADRYGFLKCHQIVERGYTPEEMFTMLQEAAPHEMKAEDPSYRKRCLKYLTTEPTRALFEKFRKWMGFRNREMEFVISAIVRSRPLLDAICDHLGITIEQFWNSSKERIFKALQTHSGKLVYSPPISTPAIFRSYGKTRVLSSIQVQLPRADTQKGLKGKTVYGQGKLVAKVKIAFKPQELENLPHSKEPLVLITGMTTPDFIPYLQKHFAALITDEGGILCHAAIVAREVKIPCIVGTGTATEKFKDGMSVKIDFDRAEVERVT